MARTLPNLPDGVMMEQLLAALACLGIVPTAEQNSRLDDIGGGHLIPVVTGVTISAPSDSEDDADFPGYPSDEGSDSDKDGLTTLNINHGPIPSPGQTAEESTSPTSTPGIDVALNASSGEDKPRPGSFQCTICGTVFDVTLQ
ncbi:hypothetical protein BDZ94DRAFT_67220 [Collybia nuda]|uniref:Uncharacterized protein n=1 Tax=Collybia nuda TaxID=64659 RepID=A0A9P5XW96_9AGAR|nr:hypothetical protein BDZ94DRAFT_67220 [Collybia nuda]